MDGGIWIKYYIEHFDLLDVRLLTLSHHSRVDAHDNFHTIGTVPLIGSFFLFGNFNSHLSIFGGAP
jgi:hypothetical protein